MSSNNRALIWGINKVLLVCIGSVNSEALPNKVENTLTVRNHVGSELYSHIYATLSNGWYDDE